MTGEEQTGRILESKPTAVASQSEHLSNRPRENDRLRSIQSRRYDQHPPRVLYASNVTSFLYKFLLPYADHFRGMGWRVDAISKGFHENSAFDVIDHFDKVWEIEWARKPHEIRSGRSIVRQIQEIVEREEYDIVHVHTPVAAMMTRYALRHSKYRRNTRVLYTAHGFHFFQGAPKLSGAVYKHLESTASRWTDLLIVMNEEDHHAARQLKGIPSDQIITLPGVGIDLSRYNPVPEHRDVVRRELSLSGEDVMLLCVAEFIPRKRQSDILRAMADLRDRRLKVAFAGEGETLESMKALSTELGLLDHVRFLGLRLDIPRLLSAADCLILPSSQEGLPRSVMESMCCGVPVIATDIRGTRDLLQGGVGRLYPPGDVPSLSKTIKDFLDDPHRNQSGALLGMERVKKYDISVLLQMHEDIYARALGVDRDLLFSSSGQEAYLL